jgi:uroporphyrinogen III methyltransferase/synthase
MIGIGPPADSRPLERAIGSIDQYDWIFFTSSNAVRAVLNRVAVQPRAEIGVVGEATKACLENLGWRVDLVPPEFSAEGLLDALESRTLRGAKVLIPSGDLAREVLPNSLREWGASIDVVEAYRNQIPPTAVAGAKEFFAAIDQPTWVLFASPSAVDNMISVIGEPALRPLKIGSIGPTTSAAVRRHGLKVAAEPQAHTIAGLVASLVEAEHHK